MEKKLRLGLIGCGGRGAKLARVAAWHHNVELVAACDTNPEYREYLAGVWRERCPDHPPPAMCETVEALLARGDIEVAMVATPPMLHAEHSILALKAGCHVFSEVPAVLTIGEGKELVDAVEKSGKVYFFGENNCYLLTIKTWKQFVREGRIGAPQYVEGEYVHDIRGLFTRDGAITWRHAFDPIRYSTHETGPLLDILDDRIVQAVGMTTSSKGYPGKPSDDLQVALFRTSKGFTYKELDGFCVSRQSPCHYFSIYGSKGFLETSRHGPLKTLAHFHDVPEFHHEPLELNLGSCVDRHPRATRHVRKHRVGYAPRLLLMHQRRQAVVDGRVQGPGLHASGNHRGRVDQAGLRSSSGSRSA